MKKYSKALNFFFWIILIALGISCYSYTENLISLIKLKDKQIASLKEIDKVNEKLNADKDKIIRLKEESITTIQNRIDSLERNNGHENVTGFIYDNKSISVEELLTMFTKIHRENEINKAIIAELKKKFGITYNYADNKLILAVDSSSMINKFNSITKEQNALLMTLNKRVDTLLDKEFVLNTIQARYHIPYTFDGKTISFKYNKFDTLLDIYPLIKDRIIIDDKKGTIRIKGL
jgi:hypothetical protein